MGVLNSPEEPSTDVDRDTPSHVRRLVPQAAIIAGFAYWALRGASPAIWAMFTFFVVIIAVNETWHAAKGRPDDERYEAFRGRLEVVFLLGLLGGGLWRVLCCSEFLVLGVAVALLALVGPDLWRRYTGKRR